jgi:hypothetical protein
MLSNADIREISRIDFGIYSAEEIKNMAVVKVTSSRFGEDPKKHIEDEDEIYLYDETQIGKSKTDTVYDEKWVLLTIKRTVKHVVFHFTSVRVTSVILN